MTAATADSTSLHSEARLAQRELILETAATAFAELGFPAASVSELARRCGVSKALLYHYYASKDAILYDLLDSHTRRLLQLCDTAEQGSAAGRDRVAALIRGFLNEYQSSRARHVVLVHDVKFLPVAQRERIQEQMRAIVARYRAAVAEAFPGEVPEAFLTPVTMMLFGMMNWTFTWLKPTGPLSYADFAEVVVRVFVEGVPQLSALQTGVPGHSGEPAVEPLAEARHP